MNINPNMTKGETNYFFYSLIFYSIAVLYLIPYELNLPYAKVGLPLLSVLLLFQIFYYRSKLLIADIIAVSLILMATFINFSTYLLFRYTLPICLIAIGFSRCPVIRIQRSYLTYLCWCTTVASIYQMTIYRRVEFDGNARVTLSNGDPNVSGLFMLLFFFVSFKARFKPGIILALISTIIFASRNYFLSLIIFFIIVILENPFSRIVSQINFMFLFMVTNFIGILTGEYYLKNVNVGFGYETGSSRLLSFNDKSNLVRFEANHFLMESYSKDLGLALTGYRGSYESVFRPIGAIVHNSFLEVFAYTGIPLGIIYFYMILRVISGYYTRENFKFIFPYLFFCLYLHSGLQGLTPFLFISILAMSVEG